MKQIPATAANAKNLNPFINYPLHRRGGHLPTPNVIHCNDSDHLDLSNIEHILVSLWSSCRAFLASRFRVPSRGGHRAFSSRSPRRSTSCISSRSRRDTGRSARPWERCAVVQECAHWERPADYPLKIAYCHCLTRET